MKRESNPAGLPLLCAPAGTRTAPPARSAGREARQKVYAREELEQRVQLFLASSNLPALRHLAVEIDGDTVILRGQVQTFYEKQLAVEFSRRVAGVIRVVDLVEVRGYAPRVDPPHSGDWRRVNFEPYALG